MKQKKLNLFVQFSSKFLHESMIQTQPRGVGCEKNGSMLDAIEWEEVWDVNRKHRTVP